jgi:hypothetical protein
VNSLLFKELNILCSKLPVGSRQLGYSGLFSTWRVELILGGKHILFMS